LAGTGPADPPAAAPLPKVAAVPAIVLRLFAVFDVTSSEVGAASAVPTMSSFAQPTGGKHRNAIQSNAMPDELCR
jgi:hypothetical protein